MELGQDSCAGVLSTKISDYEMTYWDIGPMGGDSKHKCREDNPDNECAYRNCLLEMTFLDEVINLLDDSVVRDEDDYIIDYGKWDDYMNYPDDKAKQQGYRRLDTDEKYEQFCPAPERNEFPIEYECCGTGLNTRPF